MKLLHGSLSLVGDVWGRGVQRVPPRRHVYAVLLAGLVAEGAAAAPLHRQRGHGGVERRGEVPRRRWGSQGPTAHTGSGDPSQVSCLRRLNGYISTLCTSNYEVRSGSFLLALKRIIFADVQLVET